MPILFGAMWGPHDDCDTHTLILTITIKDTFFPENEMIVNIKMCVGIYGGHGHDIFTCPSKNVHFGETETPKIILIF